MVDLSQSKNLTSYAKTFIFFLIMTPKHLKVTLKPKSPKTVLCCVIIVNMNEFDADISFTSFVSFIVYLLISQLTPENPGSHWHVNWFTPSVQLPPFWQGLWAQSLISGKIKKEHYIHKWFFFIKIFFRLCLWRLQLVIKIWYYHIKVTIMQKWLKVYDYNSHLKYNDTIMVSKICLRISNNDNYLL